MQSQAAPARFHGCYPNANLYIPKKYLPNHPVFTKSLKKLGLHLNDPHFSGPYPKLCISIKDPEIQKLAGKNLENFDDIDCKDIRCTCQDKDKYEQVLPGFNPPGESILYNACKRTIFAAAKRQVKAAPVPDAGVACHFVQWAKQKIEELIGDELDNFGYSVNQWMNHLTLPKQEDMLRAIDWLENEYDGDPHSKKLWEQLIYEGICKVEIENCDGKPRMVCSIPGLVKYIMGPVCWKLEEIFQDKIPSYCGGMNLSELAEKVNHYIDEGFEIIAEGDGSAFDNTQDVMLKAIDRYVYERIRDKVYHVPVELFDLVSHAYYKGMKIVTVDPILKKKQDIMTYFVLGTVFSGDCDTTLMNTLRMGLYNWYTNEMAGLHFYRDFVCFAKGDDFTVMYSIHLGKFCVEQAYRKYWLAKAKPNAPNEADDRVFGLGQILKFIEVGPPNIIQFCSLRAYYTSYATNHIILVRNPAKFLGLSKFSRKTPHASLATRVAYLISQAEALEVSYPQIQYFRDMAQLYRVTASILCSRYRDLRAAVTSRLQRARGSRHSYLLEAYNYDGFDYSPRHDYFTMIAGLTYWESVKCYERLCTTHLMPDEERIVNEQVEEEFSHLDLVALTGLTPC